MNPNLLLLLLYTAYIVLFLTSVFILRTFYLNDIYYNHYNYCVPKRRKNTDVV